MNYFIFPPFFSLFFIPFFHHNPFPVRLFPRYPSPQRIKLIYKKNSIFLISKQNKRNTRMFFSKQMFNTTCAKKQTQVCFLAY